jgi:hypothetical protein
MIAKIGRGLKTQSRQQQPFPSAQLVIVMQRNELTLRPED